VDISNRCASCRHFRTGAHYGTARNGYRFNIGTCYRVFWYDDSFPDVSERKPGDPAVRPPIRRRDIIETPESMVEVSDVEAYGAEANVPEFFGCIHHEKMDAMSGTKGANE